VALASPSDFGYDPPTLSKCNGRDSPNKTEKLMPYLVHKDADGAVIQFWNLHEGLLTVGRGNEANAKVEDEMLSKAHFTISHEAAGFTIKDLGSKNGTLVNGQGITQHVLKPDDRVRAGRSTFWFVEGLTTIAGKLDQDITQLGKFGPETNDSRRE
jgi:pSer/pThr/pTyr-binding forkhead associated (FHA) protein